MNLPLIKALANSSSDNGVALIVERVKALQIRFGWTIEEAVAVGDFACDVRRETMNQAFDVMMTVMKEHSL